MSDAALRRERDRRAEAAGEGAYRKTADGQWYHVTATFYPKTKLWIEDPKRREITKEELARDFTTLQL